MSDSLVEGEDRKVAGAVRFWTSQAIDSAAAARLRARIDRSLLSFPPFPFIIVSLCFLLLRISSTGQLHSPLSLHSHHASIQSYVPNACSLRRSTPTPACRPVALRPNHRPRRSLESPRARVQRHRSQPAHVPPSPTARRRPHPFVHLLCSSWLRGLQRALS